MRSLCHVCALAPRLASSTRLSVFERLQCDTQVVLKFKTVSSRSSQTSILIRVSAARTHLVSLFGYSLTSFWVKAYEVLPAFWSLLSRCLSSGLVMKFHSVLALLCLYRVPSLKRRTHELQKVFRTLLGQSIGVVQRTKIIPWGLTKRSKICQNCVTPVNTFSRLLRIRRSTQLAWIHCHPHSPEPGLSGSSIVQSLPY